MWDATRLLLYILQSFWDQLDIASSHNIQMFLLTTMLLILDHGICSVTRALHSNVHNAFHQELDKTLFMV